VFSVVRRGVGAGRVRNPNIPRRPESHGPGFVGSQGPEAPPWAGRAARSRSQRGKSGPRGRVHPPTITVSVPPAYCSSFFVKGIKQPARGGKDRERPKTPRAVLFAEEGAIDFGSPRVSILRKKPMVTAKRRPGQRSVAFTLRRCCCRRRGLAANRERAHPPRAREAPRGTFEFRATTAGRRGRGQGHRTPPRGPNRPFEGSTTSRGEGPSQHRQQREHVRFLRPGPTSHSSRRPRRPRTPGRRPTFKRPSAYVAGSSSKGGLTRTRRFSEVNGKALPGADGSPKRIRPYSEAPMRAGRRLKR